jgi:hypothetical protein
MGLELAKTRPVRSMVFVNRGSVNAPVVTWRSGFRLFGLALVVLAFAVGTIAIVDHRLKQQRINHAELLEWYCVNQGTRCGGPDPDRIERRWNERQVAYESTVVLLTLAGVVCIVLAVASGRRKRSNLLQS